MRWQVPAGHDGKNSLPCLRPVIPDLIRDLIHKNTAFYGQKTKNKVLVHKTGPFYGQKQENKALIHKIGRFRGQSEQKK